MLKNLSDQELYKKCQEVGRKSRRWQREFAYLLPEVARRNLHRQHGCAGIPEFASKMCGLSFSATLEILRVSDQLTNFPKIWASIRQHGWTKLRVIAGVVTPENQKIWLENLQKCPKRDLEKLVKKFRSENFPKKQSKTQETPTIKAKTQSAITFGEIGPSQKTTPKTKTFKFKMDAQTSFKFKELKQKLERKHGALTMGEAIGKMLEMLEKKPRSSRPQKTSSKSRHIPVAQRRKIFQQQNRQCKVRNCEEPIAEVHHVERWALSHSHQKLAGLCRSHHRLAHTGHLNEEKWTLNWQPKSRTTKTDARVREFWSG